VQVSLEIIANQGAVTGVLTFKNASSKPFHLDKYNACLGDKVTNDVFVIKAGTTQLEYKLPRIKRLSAGMDDYRRLNPGESIQTRLSLDEAYKFLEGAHDYSVRYSGIHGAPETGEKLVELVSNEVTFKHGPSQ
jgi:hypothetical protein